ncbi:MAG: CvpA family protein [Prevotellaceae bacterium]|nr:CvpA family protein [Prevotellaceae bacterium]
MIIDIIIIVVVGLGAVLGYVKGFLKQLASIAGLVAGLLVAKALYAPTADKLADVVGGSHTFVQILAFVLIWLAVPLLFTLVASLLTRALKAVSLGGVNRMLGLLLGAAKYLLLASLLVCVLEYIDADGRIVEKQLKRESRMYYPIAEIAGAFFPVAKDMTEHYLLDV